MAQGNVLREMFIKIGLIGDKKAEKKIGRFKKILNGLVGDIKVFQANLAAIAVSKAFASLTTAIRGSVTEFKALVRESSNLAAVQEEAENRLRSALEIAGDFSEQEFQGFKDFASSLQEVSRVGDEVTLGNLALAKNLGATNEQAKELVKAAVNLSEALGIDVSSATQLVGRTLQGEASVLKRYGLDLSNLSKEALKTGAAFEAINEKFGGIAEKNLRSFSAQFTQFQNAIGDAYEQIGLPINETLIPFIRQLKNDIVSLGPSFTALGRKIAESFRVVGRIFENLGGKYFIKDALKNIGEFVLDVALLFEDLFYFLRGERSFLGKILDVDFSKGILIGMSQLASGLAIEIGKLVPKIVAVVFETTFKVLYSTIQEVLKNALQTFVNIEEGIIATFQSMAFDQGLPDWLRSAFGSLGSGQTNQTTTNTINQNNTITTTQTSRTVIDELSMAQKQFKFAEGVR